MPQPDPTRIRAFAETWEHRRRNAVDASTRGAAANLREWAEVMNAQTRMLIAELQEFDPKTWDRLARICHEEAKGDTNSIECLLAWDGPHYCKVWRDATETIQDTRLWDALEELCTHAATMTANAKFHVDKLDRTHI